MRNATRFISKVAATLVLLATGATPVFAGPPDRRIIVLPKIPAKLPAQRLFAAPCRIKPNGEFPEAVARAPFALAKGTPTLVTLLSNGAAWQTSLTTSAPVAKGAEYVVAVVDVAPARSCSAVIIR